MLFATKLTALSLFAWASASSPVLSDSPTDVELHAVFEKTISGHVAFSSPNGTVEVLVDLSGLPETGGPFQYHIHQKPVPANGSCLATLGHFNPYNGSVNGTSAADKEAGDLSGKHGLIEGTSLNTSYFDPYLSLNPDSKSYFGGLSVVVHFKNSTRLACANIVEKDATSNSTLSAVSESSYNGALTYGAGVAAPLVAGAFALII